MLFLARRRPEDLCGSPKLVLGYQAISFRHFGRQSDHGGSESHIVRAWGAFFVEFGWLGLRIEGACCHFNDARPDRHDPIIAAGAKTRHPDATVMKPQTLSGVYRS